MTTDLCSSLHRHKFLKGSKLLKFHMEFGCQFLLMVLKISARISVNIFIKTKMKF